MLMFLSAQPSSHAALLLCTRTTIEKFSLSPDNQSQAPEIIAWQIGNLFCAFKIFTETVTMQSAWPKKWPDRRWARLSTGWKQKQRSHTQLNNYYKNIPRRQKAFPRREPSEKGDKALSGCPTSQPPPSTSFQKWPSTPLFHTHTLVVARFYFLINNLCVCLTCASACDSTFLPTSSAAQRKYFVSWPPPPSRRRRCDTLAPLVLKNKRAAVCFTMKNPHRLLDDFSSSYIALNKHLPALWERERGALFIAGSHRGSPCHRLCVLNVCPRTHTCIYGAPTHEFRDHEAECSINTWCSLFHPRSSRTLFNLNASIQLFAGSFMCWGCDI